MTSLAHNIGGGYSNIINTTAKGAVEGLRYGTFGLATAGALMATLSHPIGLAAAGTVAAGYGLKRAGIPLKKVLGTATLGALSLSPLAPLAGGLAMGSVAYDGLKTVWKNTGAGFTAVRNLFRSKEKQVKPEFGIVSNTTQSILDVFGAPANRAFGSTIKKIDNGIQSTGKGIMHFRGFGTENKPIFNKPQPKAPVTNTTQSKPIKITKPQKTTPPSTNNLIKPAVTGQTKPNTAPLTKSAVLKGDIITLPNGNTINISKIVRKNLKDNPNIGFIFGDNLQRQGNGGQAGEMRGEPNAFGIATLHAPGVPFTDADFTKVKQEIDKDIQKIRAHVKSGKLVIIPKNRVGTGIANLQKNALTIFKYIDREIDKIENYQIAYQMLKT